MVLRKPIGGGPGLRGHESLGLSSGPAESWRITRKAFSATHCLGPYEAGETESGETESGETSQALGGRDESSAFRLGRGGGGTKWWLGKWWRGSRCWTSKANDERAFRGRYLATKGCRGSLLHDF